MKLTQYNRNLPLLKISAVSVNANKNVYGILKGVADLTDINNFTLVHVSYISAMYILYRSRQMDINRGLLINSWEIKHLPGKSFETDSQKVF